MGNVANVVFFFLPIIEKQAAVGARPFFPTTELSIILSVTIYQWLMSMVNVAKYTSPMSPHLGIAI